VLPTTGSSAAAGIAWRNHKVGGKRGHELSRPRSPVRRQAARARELTMETDRVGGTHVRQGYFPAAVRNFDYHEPAHDCLIDLHRR
jgi:hypothetical protein